MRVNTVMTRTTCKPFYPCEQGVKGVRHRAHGAVRVVLALCGLKHPLSAQVTRIAVCRVVVVLVMVDGEGRGARGEERGARAIVLVTGR